MSFLHTQVSMSLTFTSFTSDFQVLKTGLVMNETKFVLILIKTSQFYTKMSENCIDTASGGMTLRRLR